MAIQIPSYPRAARSFQSLTKVPMFKSSLQGLVGEYGGRLVAIQAQEAEAMVQVPVGVEEKCRRGLPDWERQRGIGLQSGRTRAAETGWDALKSGGRTSDAGLA